MPLNSRSTGIFVPTEQGYSEYTEEITFKSINNIAQHFGYHPDQVHSYITASDDIHAFVFEIFTENLIFILTKYTVVELGISLVNSYKEKFSRSDEYNPLSTELILQKGIENRSLTSDYLGRVLDIKGVESDGVFFVGRLGLYLYFLNGYLVDAQPSDGLNEWAKQFNELNPDFIKKYEIEAKFYWKGNLSSVLNEINTQAEAAASVPGFLGNNNIELHKTEFGTINFVMLLVCHYNRSISLDEFKVINHGRYDELEIGFSDSPNDISVYRLNMFSYEFSRDGFLRTFSKNK